MSPSIYIFRFLFLLLASLSLSFSSVSAIEEEIKPSIVVVAKEPKQPPSHGKKATVCLNMIVKNETEVITGCFDSVLPFIDYWVISDTGSKDGTQQKIKEYMEAKDIPGELYERPWVNFGHNRDEALQFTKGKADYVLFMDADDRLKAAPDFTLPELTLDSYMIAANSFGTEYFHPRLVRTERNWHWYGVLHEYLAANDAVTREVLKGIEYTYNCNGARSQDPEKYLKDVRILTDALENEPNNERYMFYLAQSYGSAGDYPNAILHYQKRATMGGWPEEVFWSLLQVARFQEKLHVDPQVIEASYVKAFQYRPSRTEPLYYIMFNARVKGDYQKGYEIGKWAVKIPPVQDTLFVEKWTHDGVLFEHAICAWWVGKYEECLQACDTLLAKPNLSKNFHDYTVTNRMLALQKLEQQRREEILKILNDLKPSESTNNTAVLGS